MGGTALFAVMVYLLVMSSRNGQDQYDEAKRRLDLLETVNTRTDGAIFPLLLGYQTDFDLLTSLQRELRAAARGFDALRETPGSKELAGLVARKAELIEDFKSNLAVLRNSRQIGREMIDELWTEPRIAGHERELFAVDRSLLAFSARPDVPANAESLTDSIATIERDAPQLAKLPEWQTFERHAAKLLEYSSAAGQLMMSTYLLPIPEAIERQNERIQALRAQAEANAGRFRLGLFAVAVLLLFFSAAKVAQVRRYWLQIERANRELDERVRRRTAELSKANAALRSEIEERERVESQLRLAQKLESLGQLAAGVAHEINTPTQYASDNVSFVTTAWRDIVALLEDYEQSLFRGAPDEQRSRALWENIDVPYLRREIPAALEQAAYGLAQISRIVTAMREFSHPGMRSLQPADLNRAIENTTLVARNEWKYRANLVLDLDENLPPVPCDVSALSQVVLNLIVNAAQAIAQVRTAGELGRIAISTRRREDHAEISVEDDGPGVPMAIRDRIFDPFFTTKDVGAGTGQGLAIAHRVVTRQHGGTLAIETGANGRGARFVIRLPLEHNEAADDELASVPGTLPTAAAV